LFNKEFIMKKSNLWWCVVLAMALEGCPADDADAEGAGVTVTFDADGGEPATQTRTVTNGWVALPEVPTKAGCTFSGWYTLTDGGGTEFTESTIVTADLMVYAKWVITSVEDLIAFLSDPPQEGTLDDPISVRMNVDLADETDGWAKILQALAGKEKYVTLNLSDCTMSGPAFDPGTANTGKSYITGLVLPDAANSIQGGTPQSPTFQYFTNLKTLSAAEVETVGTSAFRICDSLETVSLPKATTIGEAAFNSCKGLKTVYLPEATTIGEAAFNDCKGLTTVSLPAATTIDFQAFNYCTGITEVNLPAVTTIGYGAFMGCKGLTTMSLPAAPPTLGGDIFYYTSVGSSSPITITVPNDTAVADYISKWGVVAETPAYTNTDVYGTNHKAVTIEAAVQ
jgi:uncharacterized repeat protein (TIGR02543 family)